MCLLQGKGRTLYLHRRGHIKPEEKFNFPLLSSWDYGWRLGTMESQSTPCGVVTVKWCINFRKINFVESKIPLGTKCTITSLVILCFNTRRSCNSDWLNYSHYFEFKYLKGYTMQKKTNKKTKYIYRCFADVRCFLAVWLQSEVCASY